MFYTVWSVVIRATTKWRH